MSEDTCKDKSKKWKLKAKERALENKKLQSKLKETQESRDLWKSKHKEVSLELKELQRVTGVTFSSPPAFRHQYRLNIVWFVLAMYRYGGMSLGGCRQAISSLYLATNIYMRVPCVNTIRNWTCKLGQYRIEHSSVETKEKYVVWLDESMRVGGDKVLLVIGCPLSKIDFQKSITHQEVSVLYIHEHHKWQGEQIADVLGSLDKNIEIAYLVTDAGNNLKKGAKLGDYKHVSDCTHRMAVFLSRLYRKDTSLKDLSEKANLLRTKWNLKRPHCHYMPPACCYTLRFLNVLDLIRWCKKQLDNWEKTPIEIVQYYAFIKEYQTLIDALFTISVWIDNIFRILKNKGFIEAQQVIKSLELPSVLSEKQCQFLEMVESYLKELEEIKQTIGENKIVCCSDVIESLFGKMKLKKSKTNQPSSVGNLSLSLATMTQETNLGEIKKALETIQVKDIKKCKNGRKFFN